MHSKEMKLDCPPLEGNLSHFIVLLMLLYHESQQSSNCIPKCSDGGLKDKNDIKVCFENV